MARNDGLRDYQQEMKLRLFEEWELHRSVMVQMPTGTGKTHLLAAVVKEFLCGGGVGMRVWIVAHRRELVEQIEETVARYGMGKEPDKSAKNGRTGKDSMPEESGRVRVFSIQWLSRNRKIMDGRPDLIVIDEAHHALAETYRELWKRYPEVRKLGMTATPCRLNRKGFTDLFDTLITSWSIAEFIGSPPFLSFYCSWRAPPFSELAKVTWMLDESWTAACRGTISMTDAGHSLAHFPHPTHRSWLTMACEPFHISSAWRGHILRQQPQATQESLWINAMDLDWGFI